MNPDQHPTPTALLARAGEVHRDQMAAESELLQLAAAWADAHPDLDAPDRRGFDAHSLGVDTSTHTSDPHARDLDSDHDPLIPAVDWRAPAAFAAALGMSTQAGEGLIRDALTLRHRLPLVWARVVACEVPVWRARRIARAVYARPADVADYLDAHVAQVAGRVGTVTLDRLVDEAMLRLHAEERELAQLEALDATYVVVHEETINDTGIAEATIRAEWKDLSEFDATLTDVARLLEPTHAGEPFAARRARAVGVLADPAQAAALLAGIPSDSPEFPKARHGIRLVVHTTRDALDAAVGTNAPSNGHDPFDARQFLPANPLARLETKTGGAGRAILAEQVAQWCGRPRTTVKVTEVIDLTQSITVDRYEVGDRLANRTELAHPTCVFPWCTRPSRACDKDHVVPHNKGGPTSDENLAPLCRRHHRLKTKTAWDYTTLDTGTWIWTDPHGLTYLRNHNGTRELTPSTDTGSTAA